ncbi:MAG TPA: EAL domain-containing protein [Rhodospirillales bacterium]|nr:EAL domain-containing protein [Rhodospirillales bacterium]
MADIVRPVAWFAAGAALTWLLDHHWPRHRFRHMAHDLQRALRRDEFELHYQPFVDLPSGRWVGFEALVRWRNRNGSFISPELFLPIAAETGLIEPISERVVELAARDMCPLLLERRDLHIGINVPPALLGRGTLGVLAARCGLSELASQVIIEITETGLVDDLGRAAVRTARAMGARVAIDDFGTGLNGLAQLQDLEIDLIKIDKSFVRKIGTPSPGAKLVDAVVTIADELGADVVAEGVETQWQADYLAALGVAYGQGWLFSRPLTLDEVRARLGG